MPHKPPRLFAIFWFICLIIYLYAFPVHAQKVTTFQTEIYKTIFKASNEHSAGFAVIQLPDKGFLCAGAAPFLKTAPYEICLHIFRTDSLGRPIWVKRYGNDSTHMIWFISMTQVSDSTFILLGQKRDMYGESNVLLKIDISGNVLWCNAYIDPNPLSGVNELSLNSVINAPGGNYLVSGFLGGNGRQMAGFLLLTDKYGKQIWQRTYKMKDTTAVVPEGQFGYRAINAMGGGYWFTGNVGNGRANMNFLYKIATNGDMIWGKEYFNSSVSSVNGYTNILELPGAVYIANGFGLGHFSYGFGIIKIDTSGNLAWVKSYKDIVAGITEGFLYDSTRKNLIIVSESPKTNIPRLFARLDTSGNILYTRIYPKALFGTYEIYSNQCMTQTTKGFAMMAGGDGFYLVNTDTSGKTNGCDEKDTTSAVTNYNFGLLKHTDSTSVPKIVENSVKVPVESVKPNDSVICPPFVSYLAWKDTCSGSPTRFFDSSYYQSTTRHWDFGDTASGSLDTSSAKNPKHTYNKAGKYLVKLVSGNGSVTDSLTRIVTIYSTPTQLKQQNYTACLDDSVQMKASGAITYKWNKPDMLSDSLGASVWGYPFKDTTLLVKAGNNNGCFVFDTFKIKVVSDSSCPKTNTISGVINAYATILAFDTCANALFVDSTNAFKSGDKAILIQMQGAAIDTSNSASSGTLKTCGNTGNHEYVIIDSVAGQKIYLKNKTISKYDISGMVQLVTLPQYTNVIVKNTLKARPWNGTKGGILAFEASGTVFMTSGMDVSGQGFMGGKTDSLGPDCDKTDYVYPASSKFSANKGEGIAVGKASLGRGRGAYANGGGGGNSYVAGGGGGGSYGTGGNGGDQGNSCLNKTANGGIGGFNAYPGSDRLLLGGGGGAGFAQNKTGSPGANGGGIILLKAAKLVSYGYAILANGADTIRPIGYFAAGGGGGGGGAVFLDVADYVGTTKVQAKGSNGADATSYYYCMGTGGGGAGGAVFLKSNTTSGKLSVSVNGGISGINVGDASSCRHSADGATPGTDGTVFTSISIPQGNIPKTKPLVPIISASIPDSGHVQLKFKTISDPKIVAYKIFREIDHNAFKLIGIVHHPVSSTVLYTDTILTSTDTFSYHVFAVDTCGNTYTPTQTHKTIHVSTTINSCKQAINLTWNSYIGWDSIKKYEVYRAVNGGAEALLATVANKDAMHHIITNFKDSLIDYHKSYCYRIMAYDASSSATSWSNQTCGKTFFVDTPRVVSTSKTITSKSNGNVLIHWQSIANKPHLAYTALFYSTNSQSYSLIGKFPAIQDSFVQTGVNTSTKDQYYYVKTIDSCGTISDASPIHKNMTLNVTVGQLLHKLNWTPYTGFKIKNYKIEKLVKGAFVAIDSVPGTDTFSRQFPAACNYAVFYRIAAIGYNPGEISLSDSVGRQALDTQPPNRALLKDLTIIGGTSARINFTGSDSPDVYKYVVERSVNGNWASAGDVIFTKKHDANSFKDAIKGLNPKICYTIIILDSCLNATITDTVCAIQLSAKAIGCTRQVQLKWIPGCTGSKNCPDLYEILRSTDGLNFNLVGTVPANLNAYSDTSVLVGQRYVYKLKGTNTKTGISSISDTLSVIPQLIPQASGAQFVYATVLKTDPKFGEIYVQWKRADPADTNARGYYIYSFDSTNGKYALLKDEPDLNVTSYINTNINTQEHSYKYYIITYNSCNFGVNSVVHKPVLLKASNGNLNSKLTWTDYIGETVKNYSVYKSVDGGKPFLLKDAGTDSALVDSNIHCTHTYTYQIQAMLANGKISFSDSVTIKAQDTIKPITQPIYHVSVIKTGTTSGVISMRWVAAKDNNLTGYNIQRSTDGVNWITIAKAYYFHAWIDNGIDTYDQPFYYRIQPVDSCGNEGTLSEIHKSIHLKVTAGNQFAQLKWNAYVGWKVRTYSIIRNSVLIGIVGADTLSFKDTSTICGQTYQYVIIAHGDTTIEPLLSSSNTDSIKAYDHKAPERVYIKTVTVSQPNKSATITWAPSASYDVKNYYIYLKSGPDGNLTLLDTTSTTTYTDTVSLSKNPVIPINPLNPVRNGDCYYVFAHDHCQNISPGSNEGCIIFLNANNLSGHNDLNWNSYRTWYDGIQSYNVYKNEDNTGWNLIGTTSSGSVHNYFTDKNLGDTTINFCYQVEAIENPGQFNQISRSTVACVHQEATVFIPNTFSHYNLDGLNDYFAPKGLYIKNYTMKIYNRWGELIYSNNHGSVNLGVAGQARHDVSSDGASLGWDGTFKGIDAPEGVYIYMITVEDYNHHFTNFKGNVMVIGSK